MRTYSHYLSTSSGITPYTEGGVAKTSNLGALTNTRTISIATYIPPINAGININGVAIPLINGTMSASFNLTAFFPTSTTMVVRQVNSGTFSLTNFLLVSGLHTQPLAAVLSATTFTATIELTTVNVLNVSAVTGTLSVGQYVLIGTTIAQIVSFETLSGTLGGPGLYILDTSTIAYNETPTAYTSLASYTLRYPVTPTFTPAVCSFNANASYIFPFAITFSAQTASPIYNFTSQTYSAKLSMSYPLSQTKYSINWREIFRDKIVGECRVRVRLISNTTTPAFLPWGTTASLRCSFASNTSSSYNGFNIGPVTTLIGSNTSTANTTTYLDCDTTSTSGATIIIPNTNSDFTISLLNSSENLLSNVPDYQIWFYFDVE